jgi:hypothetical protein
VRTVSADNVSDDDGCRFPQADSRTIPNATRQIPQRTNTNLLIGFNNSI